MRLFRSLFRKGFTASGDYWSRRYADGGTSGAGSYGRLAQYKAEIINTFVAEHDVRSVIEFGSGDGNQAALFDFQNYTGVDLVPQVVAQCRARFFERPGWQFVTASDDLARGGTYDLALSLDVVYHLTEDGTFDAYMRRLSSAAGRFLLVYASDHEQSESGAAHVRHRNYSRWLEKNAPELRLARTWEHPYPMLPGSDPKQTSFAFFRCFERSSD